MDCELCGAKNARRKTQIEGAVLSVCDKCVTMGREIAVQAVRSIERSRPAMPEELELNLRSDAASIVRRERERRGLSQEQLAQKLAEKVSIIKRIEEGWTPTMVTIRKLERFLNIKLMESAPVSELKQKVQNKQLTMGDVAEIIE
jgi:putative transcription factor